MHFTEFLDSIYSSISSMIGLLKDSRIANYMFGGVSLWAVLISFFCGFILLKFFLNPIGGGSILFYREREHREDK